MHKANANFKGALEACKDIISVLSTSNDFDERTRNTKMAISMRDIADLHQAQGNLQFALEHASGSVNLFRAARASSGDEIMAMDVDNCFEEERSLIEEEASSLHLVG